MQKRFISLFIATAAILSACCGVFYAQNQGKKVSNTTPYPSYSFTFSLNDAGDSLQLCAIAGYPEALSKKLEIEGFEDIEFFQYENSLKSDNKAGLALAHKEGVLLAVIRGTKDEEWYSNFYVGEGAEHAGFSSAAQLVLENIEYYINRYSLQSSDTVIHFTGHSRGAAVANLAASRLIDNGLFKNVSAYTFACPNTTTSTTAELEKYRSIVNIINPQDFICYIPLPQWNYKRYGQTVELPKSDTTENFDALYEKMSRAYATSNCTELRDFPNKGEDVESIISYLYYLAPTVEDYYQKEIAVGSLRLTMYDYMMKLAAVMNNENPLLHGLFMLSCKAVPEVCPITDFVFSGLSDSEITSADAFENTAVVANHMPEAYFAWLNTLEESYFVERLMQ